MLSDGEGLRNERTTFRISKRLSALYKAMGNKKRSFESLLLYAQPILLRFHLCLSASQLSQGKITVIPNLYYWTGVHVLLFDCIAYQSKDDNHTENQAGPVHIRSSGVWFGREEDLHRT